MKKTDIYPLIIISDGYGGLYSGAEFIAWNCFLEQLHLIIDQEGGDFEAQEFWDNYSGYPLCGKGNTIEEAVINLDLKINKQRSNENGSSNE